MRLVTIFGTLFVLSAAVLVNSSKTSGHNENFDHSFDNKFAPQSYMDDLIYYTLGVTPGAFLATIENQLSVIRNSIDNGMMRIHDLMHKVDPQTQDKIRQVINKALTDAVTEIVPVLEDLGRVVPSITRSASARASVSDTIRIILGITFEDFLRKIEAVLQISLNILTNTMNELGQIANTIPDSSVSAELRSISTTYLDPGRVIIRPILNNLHQILPTALSNMVLANVVSVSLRLDVIEATAALEDALERVENILTSFTKKVNKVLSIAYPNITMDINTIILSATKKVERIIDPVLKVFFTLGKSNMDVGANDIMSTLLGSSLEDFLFYMDLATGNVEIIFKNATIEIRGKITPVYPLLKIYLSELIEDTQQQVTRAVTPFINAINPIIGERRWVSFEEFVEITDGSGNIVEERVFCDFSLRTGHNKDLIIHLVSKVLGVDMVESADAFMHTLHDWDDLYTKSREEVEEAIKDMHPFVIADVSRILNNSMTATRRAIQPAIDVFVEFLPHPCRRDKDAMQGMIQAINSLSKENFQKYINSAIEGMSSTASRAFYEIHHIVESGKPAPASGNSMEPSNPDPIVEAVDEIMMRTLNQTVNVAKPFLDLVSNLIELEP